MTTISRNFSDIKCIFFHNDHEDKSKNQQTRNGTITKSVGCFVNHVEGSFFFFHLGGEGLGHYSNNNNNSNIHVILA